ncbi:MarR family winged helix-turn-helix transcriptional regulator [Arenibacterium halophilum]|uniref:MarR family transcriptional regulator n=1 Tax=Arenibacterium halophilum TaxID=2583821 RepID=A0ABY2X5V2_9RHOB|nr:MarR family transcriptional regulator [Arenibacterium halophilum]TMV10830.1 MarR family transcriptional regulator [Arenibacterium halophilum]
MTKPMPTTDDLLCFALYSTSHAMMRLYRPLLAPLGLTYPQYLVLVALWDRDGRSVGDLGEQVALESNTLTPLLKRMETAGLINRRRGAQDERVVTVHLTDAGSALKDKAAEVTACVFQATGLSLEEVADLRARVEALRHKIEAAG